MIKEHGFVSAVIAVEDDSEKTLEFIETVYNGLDEHFSHFELIAVNTCSSDNDASRLKAWGLSVEKPVTIIYMSLHQPHEQCMNAGLDCAIGDYIYEFDFTELSFNPKLIWEAYMLSQEGNDIVMVCPVREKVSSRLFYRVFNTYSDAAYPLRTDAFRLVTRRAVNRVHSISDNLPYRKAAYAACGLKMTEIEFDGRIMKNRRNPFVLATDSLVLYTNFGYRFSLSLTVLMLAITVAELIYTLVIWRTGHPVPGWTTMMFVMTFGLTGVFAVLAILLKYMSLLLKIVFHKQSYLIEGIEKL